MCYAKPGPRCSSQVRKELDAATTKVVSLRDAGASQEKIKNAEAVLLAKAYEYDATSEGQDEIRRQIQEKTNVGENAAVKVLERRLAQGVEVHEKALSDFALAQRAKSIVESHQPSAVASEGLSLKDMDAVMLSMALREEIRDLPDVDRELVESSMQLAAYVHRHATRKSPTRNSRGEFNQPTAPYIEHPLRNALRACRWGVKDAPTLAGIVLHDTVEDHHVEIARENVGMDVKGVGEEKTREAAFSYLSAMHGTETSDLVRSVSNPVMDLEQYDRVAREEKYAEHVAHEVMSSAKTFVIKFSDFADNALSAHHHEIDKRAYNRSRKYLKVCATFRVAAQHHDEALSDLLSVEGKRSMLAKVHGAEAYLRAIIDAYDKKSKAQ